MHRIKTWRSIELLLANLTLGSEPLRHPSSVCINCCGDFGCRPTAPCQQWHMLFIYENYTMDIIYYHETIVFHCLVHKCKAMYLSKHSKRPIRRLVQPNYQWQSADWLPILKVRHTWVVAETSRKTASNAAVSSACFLLCRAIFSLNFRGFAI